MPFFKEKILKNQIIQQKLLEILNSFDMLK